MLKAMAEVAILASTEEQDCVILNDGEELDSWNVIIQGSVSIKSVESDEVVATLTDGQCFGVTASREKQIHKNVLTSATDNCQFLCVSKDDFCRIAEDSKLKLQEHTEDSTVVMVTEHRSLENGQKQGHVIIKATPKKLLENLIDSSFMLDPTYVEDFLICHRVFFKGFSETTAQLLDWLETPGMADKAVKIIILWINYCYEDFVEEPELSQFLKDFVAILKKKNMKGPLRFIHIACAGRTAARTVKYDNSSFGQGGSEDLKIVGGLGTSVGVYIVSVLPDGSGFKAGLREGDEITVINKNPAESLTTVEVNELIKSSEYITITYKRCITTKLIMQDQIDMLAKSANILPFNSVAGETSNHSTMTIKSVSQLDRLAFSSNNSQSEAGYNSDTNSTGNAASSGKKKLKKFLRLKMFTKGFKVSQNDARNKHNSEPLKNQSTDNLDGIPLDILYNKSYSISIINNRKLFDGLLDRSLTVSKVFKPDGTSKCVVLSSKVKASEIVQISFDNDENYTLNCVSIDCKTMQVNDQIIKPNENFLHKYEDIEKRFYIKKQFSPTSVESVVNDIRKNLGCDFIDLDPSIVAKAISINNFDNFTRIKVKEYIYNIFEIKNKEKYPNLTYFVDSCNKELFWVVNEIIDIPTISGRAKAIENFIKIAYICKELKNLNSVFFIISGLMHSAVKALTTSWEKVLPKYMKIYNNLQQLLDPSRNMMKYRALLNDKSRPTLIPIFPVLQKDLTFINDGNSTWNEDLINFEKLRMISKEIRSITQYYSGTFDYMQLFTTKEIHAFKVSYYIQIPFRPKYLMQEETCDHVPMSDLGMTNFATKAANLHAEQTRLLSTLVNHPKELTKETLMEKRVFKYIKTRLDSLETAKDVLVSRAKFIETNATVVAHQKKSNAAFSTQPPVTTETREPPRNLSEGDSVPVTNNDSNQRLHLGLPAEKPLPSNHSVNSIIEEDVVDV